MRTRWLGVAIVALIAIAITALARAAAEPDFAFDDDRAARVGRINFEIRQIATEKARLDEERLGLMLERSCVMAAKDRPSMRLCARR